MKRFYYFLKTALQYNKFTSFPFTNSREERLFTEGPRGDSTFFLLNDATTSPALRHKSELYPPLPTKKKINDKYNSIKSMPEVSVYQKHIRGNIIISRIGTFENDVRHRNMNDAMCMYVTYIYVCVCSRGNRCLKNTYREVRAV